jgi:glycosyltransferase involved in cell wall biosynthesis
VLDQLCRFLPPGSLACFALVNPQLDARLSPDLDWIPIAYTAKRDEAAFRALPGKLSFVSAYCVETMRRRYVVPRILRQAVEFAREQQIDAVWAVLQGQTLIQMAPELADQLGVPLFTQVWDPLSWWLVANRIDRLNRRAALADFDRALRVSKACAVASWAMAAEYKTRYGTFSVPVIASHSSEIARRPDPSTGCTAAEITIGMAGQFYAATEWLALVRALNMAHWRVSEKRVRIVVAGPTRPPGDVPPGRVEYLGWQAQAEVLRILADCDILYCPYPFDSALAEVSRLSFPSKLTLYLAAGRPVLFHGPSFSSPARYLEEREAALCIGSELPSAIYNGLARLVDEPLVYRRIAECGQAAFQRDFTLDAMRDCFFEFLGITGGAVAQSAESYRQWSPVYLSDVRALIPPRIKRLVNVRALVPQRAKRLVKSLRPAFKGIARQLPYVRRLSRYIGELEARQRLLTEELEKLRAAYSRVANRKILSDPVGETAPGAPERERSNVPRLHGPQLSPLVRRFDDRQREHGR